MATRAGQARQGADDGEDLNRNYKYVNKRCGSDVTTGQVAMWERLVDVFHRLIPRIQVGAPFVSRFTLGQIGPWSGTARGGDVVEYTPKLVAWALQRHDVMCTVYTSRRYGGVIVFNHGPRGGNDATIGNITRPQRLQLIADAYRDVHGLNWGDADVQGAMFRHIGYCNALGGPAGPGAGHVVLSRSFPESRAAMPVHAEVAAP